MTAWDMKISFPVTLKEAAVLERYVLRVSMSRPLTEGASVWSVFENALNEMTKAVEFQVDDQEARALEANGADVRKGMAFLSPQQAEQIMVMMAQDQSPFKDVPTVTSIVRKIAYKLGQKMPKVFGSGSPGKPGDETHSFQPASAHPGTGQAKYKSGSPVDLESPEQFQKTYGRTASPESEQGLEELEPLPDDYDPNQFMQQVQSAEKAARSGQMAQAPLKDTSHKLARIKPSKQAAPASDFFDLKDDPDFQEAKRLLRVSSWRVI